jgi:uncharacterized protein
MRLILDCNILVSATWNDGICRRVFVEAIKKHTPLVSSEILNEYARVMTYSKFDKIRPAFKKLYFNLIKNSIFLSSIKSPFTLPDPEDEIYLDLAYTANAEAIITGNRKHFPEPDYNGIKILSPREFIDSY